jgi:DNA-binding GntR family transcriptional regulator
VEPTTKADELALEIERAIIAGDLEPGTVLRQETLSEQFAVSRTPVREALRQLAAIGLVSSVPNRGVRVRELSHAELREAFMVRAELEGLAVELATPRITEAELAALAAAEARFAELTHAFQPGGVEEGEIQALIHDWLAANDEFHDLLLRAARAPLVERMAKAVRRTFHVQAYWRTQMGIAELYEENLRQHRAIVEAMAARSPRGARALAVEHVLSSGRLQEVLLERLESARRGRVAD